MISSQVQKVAELADSLANMITTNQLLLNHYARNDNNDESPLESEWKRVQVVLLEQKRKEELQMRKICALQQYLALELISSDRVLRDIKSKEDENELLAAECNELLKHVGSLL